MKLFIFATAIGFCSLAHAQSAFKDLSHHPIRFDSAYDTQPNSSMTLFSMKEGIYGRVSCGRSPAGGFAYYFDMQVYNRTGNPVGSGYQYMSVADCQNFLRELFDHPEKYEFEFGPLNYWGNRELKTKSETQDYSGAKAD